MMKRKLLWALLFMAQVITDQDLEQCRKIVNLTVQSIDSHSTKQLTSYLSEDFTIAGHTGELAKMILTQLLTQLDETVKSHEELELLELKDGLQLKYKIDYQKKGVNVATFIFNENNLLRSLDLFKMEVKTMKNESVVQKSSKDLIEIPFKMIGNLIAVDVTLNGELRTFIFDSGAPRVILNSKYLTASEASRSSMSSAKGVSSYISGLDIEVVDQLDFVGIQLNDQKVMTLDLSHLEEELEMNFHGLIGYELIKEYDIIFDYENLLMLLINPQFFEIYRAENLTGYTLKKIPLKLKGHLPVLEAQINNKPYYFGIDSGAESNLMSDGLFNILEKYTSEIRLEELNGADGIIKEGIKGKLESIKIGDKEFTDMQTMFSDISHLNEGHELMLDGLMGYELLSKQKTLISFVREEMIFIE